MKTYHSCFDVKWLLRRPHGELGRMIKGEGKPLSAEKAFDFLLDKWREGWHVLPVEPCDSFDKVKGCLGHEDKA